MTAEAAQHLVQGIKILTPYGVISSVCLLFVCFPLLLFVIGEVHPRYYTDGGYGATLSALAWYCFMFPSR